jgi:hypothetical protein
MGLWKLLLCTSVFVGVMTFSFAGQEAGGIIKKADFTKKLKLAVDNNLVSETDPEYASWQSIVKEHPKLLHNEVVKSTFTIYLQGINNSNNDLNLPEPSKITIPTKIQKSDNQISSSIDVSSLTDKQKVFLSNQINGFSEEIIQSLEVNCYKDANALHHVRPIRRLFDNVSTELNDSITGGIKVPGLGEITMGVMDNLFSQVLAEIIDYYDPGMTLVKFEALTNKQKKKVIKNMSFSWLHDHNRSTNS